MKNLNSRSIRFALTSGLAILPMLAISGVFWDASTSLPVNNGGPSFAGYISGEVASMGRPQRWHAIPVVIPAGGVSINHIELQWVIEPGYEAADVRMRVLRRTALNAPNNANDLISDQVIGAYAPGTDDPRINGTDDWLHTYDLTSNPIVLAAGNYWMIPYASGDVDPMFPTADHGIGHFAGAWGASEVDNIEGPMDGLFPTGFFYRSSAWPSPGFAKYNANGIIAPLSGYQLEAQDTWNHNLLLAASNRPDATLTGNAELSDIDPFAISFWDFFIAECRDSNNNVLKNQAFVMNNALSTNTGSTYVAPYTIHFAVGNRPVDNIRIKGGTFLARTVSATNGTADITFINGDWDGDNELTLVDFGAVSAAFGFVNGDPEYDAFADFNLDGEVNLVDIGIIAGNFGLAGDE